MSFTRKANILIKKGRNLSGKFDKYSRKIFGPPKRSPTDIFKTASKKAIQKKKNKKKATGQLVV